MTTIEELETLFDDHPSLDASLRDFENGASDYATSHNLPVDNLKNLYPSHHSGFRSEDEDSEMGEQSLGGYSPPAWRRMGDGRSSGFWNRNDSLRMRDRGSRDDSPAYESADDGYDQTLAAAVRTRLPTGSLSPEKRRSPSPYPEGEDFGRKFGEVKKEDTKDVALASIPESPNNYIRFAVRAEVQHRTEPIEKAISFIITKYNRVTRTWTSLISSMIIGLVLSVTIRSVFQPAHPLPVPDLVKVAGLAKAFEPLIFYSENGVQQIGDLQATGVAVWDLGESIRNTNMTSAPIIVKELDGLSESLKTLAIELTRFFANVDGDVDGILIVMDWARRELSHLPTNPPSPLTSLFSNTHTLLSRLRILQTASGQPTALGQLVTSLFGPTPPQRTAATLQRTFHEFLSVLEDAINSELSHSTALFALFESIDRQFLNLARAVSRESDTQERLESELLSSLWTRVLGANGQGLRKFEANRKLLHNVRAKTVHNKRVLIDHNGKLLGLKANLEMLRMRLVSPLVRGRGNETGEWGGGSILSVEEQVRGLEEVGGFLRVVREGQRSRVLERLYGAGANRNFLGKERDGWEEIEGRN